MDGNCLIVIGTLNGQLFALSHEFSGNQYGQNGRAQYSERCGNASRGTVAFIIDAVALFPVHAILEHTPVANTRNSRFGHGRTLSNDLAPSTIP